MSDGPILFSAPMIRSMLAGTKTETRRILKPQPPEGARYAGIHYASDESATHFFNTPHGGFKVHQRFAVGDRLWVREAFSYEALDVDRNGFMPPWYWADGNPVSGDFTKPKPSIHMPRWASRLTLTVTDVRVQRLQDISGEDAFAEGVETDVWDQALAVRNYAEPDGWFCMWGGPECYTAPGVYVPMEEIGRASYRSLWEHINGAGSWDANPWIVALAFTVERANIDANRPICEAVG